MTNYSEILASWVSETSADDIPEEVRERCRQSIMNGTAAALSASNADPTERLLKVLLASGRGGDARLFGRSERLDLLNAVLVNGYMGHLNDYDDTHLGTTYHTNPSNVPALLGLGSTRHANGTDAVAALALGLEASIRFGIGLGRVHYDVGWHTTGTLGAIGVALTCSRLLGLDPERTNWALALACTQAAGLRGLMFGSMAKGFNAAKAAYNGLLAALLAEQSFTAAPNAIEGARGYANSASHRDGHVYLNGERSEPPASEMMDLSRITDGLGSRWETLNIGFKPYASGAATHATIDCVLALRSKLGLDENSSEREVDAAMRRLKTLKITIPARSLHLPRGREISSPLEAKFSMYNVAAIVLTRGKAGPGEYNDDALVDPTIAFLRELIELVGDPNIAMGSGSLVAQLEDGNEIDIHIDHALGTIYRPLDIAALEKKLFDASDGVLERSVITDLTDRLANIEQLSDLSEIMELASL